MASIYLLFILAPLFALLAGSLPATRDFWTEFSVAIGYSGLAMMGLGGLSFVATVVMKWVQGIFWTGNPFLLLSVMLELMGIQFISIGLLGEVLTRTYFESQGKPPYVVRSTRNLDGTERRAA